MLIFAVITDSNLISDGRQFEHHGLSAQAQAKAPVRSSGRSCKRHMTLLGFARDGLRPSAGRFDTNNRIFQEVATRCLMYYSARVGK